MRPVQRQTSKTSSGNAAGNARIPDPTSIATLISIHLRSPGDLRALIRRAAQPNPA